MRKLEGYDGRPGYLTRGKRAEGKAISGGGQGVTFFLALESFQMSYFSKVSKEDPLPVSNLHLGFETYRKQSPFPWPLSSSKLNLNVRAGYTVWSLLLCLGVLPLPGTVSEVVLLPINCCFSKFRASCLKIWLSSSPICKTRSLDKDHWLTLGFFEGVPGTELVVKDPFQNRPKTLPLLSSNSHLGPFTYPFACHFESSWTLQWTVLHCSFPSCRKIKLLHPTALRHQPMKCERKFWVTHLGWRINSSALFAFCIEAYKVSDGGFSIRSRNEDKSGLGVKSPVNLELLWGMNRLLLFKLL